MEELSLFLGYMPVFIITILKMVMIFSFLKDAALDRVLREVFPAVASAAAAVASAAAVVAFFGLPGSLTLLFLGVASAAFWDRETVLPAVVVVEEYLDDEDLARLIQQGDQGNLLALEDERETARRRIAELEADNLRLVAQLATELLEDNNELQEIFGLLPLDPRDPPHPNVVREVAHA